MNLSDRKTSDRGEYEQQIAYKCSDFSIDHILNRAGNTNNRTTDQPRHIPVNSNQTIYYQYENRNDFIVEDYLHYEPTLNWLHYSRYHPPRLPRPVKIGPMKRTPGRLPRVPFTPHQLNALEDAYKKTTYLSSEDANNLAIKLELTSTRVKIWFQNRRARERREKRGTHASSSPEYDVSFSPNNDNPLRID